MDLPLRDFSFKKGVGGILHSLLILTVVSVTRVYRLTMFITVCRFFQIYCVWLQY